MRLGEPKSSLSRYMVFQLMHNTQCFRRHCSELFYLLCPLLYFRLRQLKEEVLAKKKKIEEEVAMVGVAEKL